MTAKGGPPLWLSVRTGPDAGSAVEIPADAAFVLGRQRGCDMVVRDARASRRHVELKPEPGGVRLRDLGSANGTVVDGVRVHETLLEGGEEIRIGDVIIAVTSGPPSAPGARPESDAVTRVEPRLATPSMVRRLVDAGTRRARRAALAAGAVAALAVAAVAVLLVTGGADDPVPEVVERLAPSTVQVLTQRDAVPTGNGSGWVLDAGRGLIVTNAHVVNQGSRFAVLAGGREREATVVSASPCEDLALLRVRDTAGLRGARLGAAASVSQGETVVALGYGPGDAVGSTTGVVSVVSTGFRDPAPDVPAYPEVVQTDTALNPGNSGGPLADLDGRVIGVNSAARSTGSDGRPLQNVNYAIAIDRARRVLADLERGRAEGWTGLTFGYPSDGELQEAGLPPGLRITGAIPGTPGAEAAITPGSLLAGVDGEPIANTLSSFCEAVAGRRTGDEVVLSFAEPGRDRTREVPLRLA